MKAVEKFCSREPEWILDRKGSGPLFWRRDSSETKSRVKFRYEVDIKEFQRQAHEIEDNTFWSDPGSNFLTSGLCVIFCVSCTVFLPWYIFLSSN